MARAALVEGAVIAAWVLVACSGGGPEGYASGFRSEASPCTDPLMEMVTWRDQLNADLVFGKQHLTADQVAALERDRVNAVVAQLTPLRASCQMTWNVGLFNEPQSPSDRLREEAVLMLLDRPSRTFPPNTLGQAGRQVRDP